MDEIVAFANSLTATNWIQIVFGLVAAIGVILTATNYFAGRRARQRELEASTPTVNATINATAYRAGWRSVQLHVLPKVENQPNFSPRDWCIERARLLSPAAAVLARAENDDYASGVFYPDEPVRALEGKGEGRVQRFALEFFIKFQAGEDSGTRAKFRVTYSRVNGQGRRTITVWAALPNNAEPAPLETL